jgi:hypothetical protein
MLIHQFESGEEPEVLTANLCDHFGGCDQCPGTARAGDLKVQGYEPDEIVFVSTSAMWRQPEAN